MTNKPSYYKPTGKLDLANLGLTLLLIPPLWFITFLYAGLLHWNPIKVLNPGVFFFYLLSVHLVIVLAIEASKTRNIMVGRVITFCFIGLSIYFSWANFLSIWSGGLPTQMLQPQLLISTFTQLYQEGSYSILWIQNDGLFGITVWLIEVACFGYFGFTIAVDTVKDEVYCESCDHWVNPLEKFYTFYFKDVKSLVAKLKAQDLSFIEEIEDEKNDDNEMYSLDVSSCTTCNSAHFLTLTREGDEALEEEKLVEHLKVSTGTYDTLFAKSKHYHVYTESGKFTHWIWLSLPPLAAIVFFASALYQRVAIWAENYFVTGVLWILFCYFLYIITTAVITFFSIRSSIIARVYGLVAGTIVVYLTHVSLLHALTLNVSLVFDIDVLWKMLETYIHFHEFEGIAWFFLLFESITFFFITMIGIGAVGNDMVYCEKDKQWAEEEEGLLEFHYPDGVELGEKFPRQELDFLDKVTLFDQEEGESRHFRINGHRCDQCKNIHTLTLEAVTITRTDTDYRHSYDSIFTNVLVTKNTYEQIKLAGSAATTDDLSSQT